MRRGGARKGAGRPPGPSDKPKRKMGQITVFPHEWKQLDEIGPSRGKAVSKLLRESKIMNIESGWSLLSADFSLQASGSSETGSVMLVRDIEGIVEWHKLDDELRDSDDCPELYISGKGATIGEAIANANLAAAGARTISS